MPVLDPREYVDRERQQDLLRDMIDGRDEARVLVVTDSSGQGKTDLLLRLRVNCREGATRTPVLLADLRDLSTPFGAVERAASHDANMDVVKRILTGYAAVYERRSSAVSYRIEGPPGDVDNRVLSTGTVEAGGVVAGQYFASPPQPTGLESRIAQQECCLAFLGDLACWTDSPLVVLVDHFNKAKPSLQAWVDEELVRPCLRGELGRVIVVLASTPDVVPAYDRFRPRVHVTRLDPLHTDPVHVETLLRAHRLLSEPDDPLLPVAVDRLRRGMAVGEIIDYLFPLALSGGGDGR